MRTLATRGAVWCHGQYSYVELGVMDDGRELRRARVLRWHVTAAVQGDEHAEVWGWSVGVDIGWQPQASTPASLHQTDKMFVNETTRGIL